MKVALIGAGGHAKGVVEALIAKGVQIVAYIDSHRADWLNAVHLLSDEELSDTNIAIVVGLGGVTPDALMRRRKLIVWWAKRGFQTPAVVHPTALVSQSAQIADAAQVLAGAIVQPNATVRPGAIVNSGAIVEHDAYVGEGAHIAPGAVVLGGARIGMAAMVGTNAVVLPGEQVPDGETVRAASIWRKRRG